MAVKLGTGGAGNTGICRIGATAIACDVHHDSGLGSFLCADARQCRAWRGVDCFTEKNGTYAKADLSGNGSITPTADADGGKVGTACTGLKRPGFSGGGFI